MDLFDLYDKISRSIQFFQCNISGDTEGLLQICDEVRGENSQNQLNILFMGNRSINNEAFPKRFFDVKEELYLREECQDFPRYFKERSKTKPFAYYVLQWNNENDKQANCSFNFNNICDTLKIVCVFSMIDTFGNVDKTGYSHLE